MTLSSILNDIVPQFQSHVVSLLINACPFAVRNKFSVILEGIVSFQDFEAVKFEPLIAPFATASLKKHSFLSILIDSEYQKDIETGFDVPTLGLNVLATKKATTVVTNEQRNCFLFFSTNYSKDELYQFDGAIYKYFALLAFSSFITRVIDILKSTRDHIVPLRRRLSIALQRRTEEYLDTLNRTKKYLTYVNIKLPVVYKVINHLNDALNSKQFRAKIDTFAFEKIV
jgi:hypothetical protein